MIGIMVLYQTDNSHKNHKIFINRKADFMGKIPQKDIIAHENRMIKYKQFTEKSIENTTH